MFKFKNNNISQFSITKSDKAIAKNTTMLYLLTIAKLIFPLLTLPYLTRVLSTDCYGTVAYVKATMGYMQLIVDFGFLYSAVKDIVNVNNDKVLIGMIAGDVFIARLFLAMLTIALSFILSYVIPILRAYRLYTMLASTGVALSAFLADFLFYGIEKMHVAAIVFIIMKGVATVLTFLLVKDDDTIILIPILDIIGTLIADIVTFFFIKAYKIKIKFTNIKNAWSQLKSSFVYFLSNIATTAFTAFNTLMLGIVYGESGAEEIAFWSVCMQLVSAVQNLYTPINNGIYPQMVKERSLSIIRKALIIFMPIVLFGCLFCYFAAEWILLIVSGEDYVVAVDVFRSLIPLMFISFPTMLFGWPTLGGINKAREVTVSTVVTAILQIYGVLILIIIGKFTLINIAFLRAGTEFFMLFMRVMYIIKYRKLFRIHLEVTNE